MDEIPLYTNSTQLPVNFSNDIFQVLDLQDPLQTRYTGGTVLHAYLGEAVADPNAVKAFVRTVCDKYRLPYFTLSPSFSICPVHGYLTGEIKHHQAIAAQEAGLTVICLSHTVSERFALKNLAKQLKKRLKNVTIAVSKKDKDPFTWINV